MNPSLFMVVSLIHLVIALKNPHEKCEFKDTVDLTNQTRYENGSYLYQNILIPEHKLANYNYRLEFRNKNQVVDLHTRGCVCDAQKRRFCVKLCCNPGDFFDETTSRCAKLPRHRKPPTDLKIKLKNQHRYMNVNIFDHFVHQVGLPCAKPKVLSAEGDIWDISEDGILEIHSENIHLDTVSYCITPHRFHGADEDVLMPLSCQREYEDPFLILLNIYAISFSTVFLILTILVYLLIKELRSNLRGKLLICYLFPIAVAYLVKIYLNIDQKRLGFTTCNLLKFTGYFFYMSAFMWLSVLCFDIWNNFKEIRADLHAQNSRIRFAFYSLYAWGSAGLFTGFVAWSHMSDQVGEFYKPGNEIEICWLDTRKWSAALYLYWLNSFIIVFTIITFAHLTLRIYRVRNDLARITSRVECFEENAAVIPRLLGVSCTIGVPCIIDILSFCVRDLQNYDILFIITDLCYAIQGLLIFILFVLKPNVIALIKAKFQPRSRETYFSRLTSLTSTTTIPASP